MVLVSMGKDVLHKQCGAEPGFVFIELYLNLEEYECAHSILCKTNITDKMNIGFLHWYLSPYPESQSTQNAVLPYSLISLKDRVLT